MSNEWLVDGSLVYRLNEEGANCDEIIITMFNGSRHERGNCDAARYLSILLNEFTKGNMVHTGLL